jgi:hypothetical protein
MNLTNTIIQKELNLPNNDNINKKGLYLNQSGNTSIEKLNTLIDPIRENSFSKSL